MTGEKRLDQASLVLRRWIRDLDRITPDGDLHLAILPTREPSDDRAHDSAHEFLRRCHNERSEKAGVDASRPRRRRSRVGTPHVIHVELEQLPTQLLCRLVQFRGISLSRAADIDNKFEPVLTHGDNLTAWTKPNVIRAGMWTFPTEGEFPGLRILGVLFAASECRWDHLRS